MLYGDSEITNVCCPVQLQYGIQFWAPQFKNIDQKRATKGSQNQNIGESFKRAKDVQSGEERI